MNKYSEGVWKPQRMGEQWTLLISENQLKFEDIILKLCFPPE